MRAFLYHIQLNVSDAKRSLPFWKDMLGYFEFQIIDESSEHIGMSNGTTDVWIVETESKYKTAQFHRKHTGMNHLAFGVSSKEEVDSFCNEFLKPRGIQTLYNTPKYYPEYSDGYYAVFFEDPDRIKLEVVFVKAVTHLRIQQFPRLSAPAPYRTCSGLG